MFLFVLLLPLLLTGALGCLDNIINPPKASSPYLPLAVGNWWRYQDADREWTVSCNAAVRVGSEDIYVVTDVYHELPWENTYYYFNTTSLQVYIPIPFSSTAPPPSLYTFQEMLRVPIVSGQSYTNIIGTWTVESLSETVTVPAGDFSSCAKIKIEPLVDPGFSNTHELYLAPNVGLVKSVNPAIDHVIELQAYSVH